MSVQSAHRVRPLAGRLLVAAPGLKDPNFERSVVYMLSHDRDGAYGVILNRATDVPVADALSGALFGAGLASEPAVVFEGGPVEPETAICLVRLAAGVTAPSVFESITGAVGTVDLSVNQGLDAVADMRVFAGYAGWDAPQLRDELAEGAWLVLDALPGDAFMPQPDDLWQLVLRRQGGMLAAVAVFPPDPILN